MAVHDQLIARRFQPLGKVEEGGALRARDLETAQTVVLHPVADFDRRLVGIFHPSLLTIFEVVEHDGRLLAASEFVPARTLEAVLGGDRCHPRRAAEIVSELADGVAELHGRGITHGAISIGSVWLTAKGKAKLTLVDAAGGGSESADVRALRAILEAISARPFSDLHTESAAVLSALLRS